MIGRIGLISLIGLMFLTNQAHAVSYFKTIKKEIRKDSYYSTDNFHAGIIWSALPLTNTVLGAQAKEYQKTYDVSETERSTFHDTLLKKRERKAAFFISFYTYNQKFGDLTKNQGHWDIRLKQGGKEWQPYRIEKISRPSPFDRLFYPHLDAWSEAYFIWFDTDESLLDSSYSLSIHGPEAGSTLEWKK